MRLHIGKICICTSGNLYELGTVHLHAQSRQTCAHVDAPAIGAGGTTGSRICAYDELLHKTMLPPIEKDCADGQFISEKLI